MSAPLPVAQHGAVLASIKATPSGWPRLAPSPRDDGTGRLRQPSVMCPR